jgi:hypothetical protein
MNTEEYYAAINRRIADMKTSLKKGLDGGNPATVVDDYFASLSKPRPTA